MNFYILFHSKYGSEFSIKYCIGFVEAYFYGENVHFEKMTDTPNEHHNNFILNQMPYFHIKSPFKLMNDIFESLPKLFVDILLK